MSLMTLKEERVAEVDAAIEREQPAGIRSPWARSQRRNRGCLGFA